MATIGEVQVIGGSTPTSDWPKLYKICHLCHCIKRLPLSCTSDFVSCVPKFFEVDEIFAGHAKGKKEIDRSHTYAGNFSPGYSRTL